MLLRSVRRSHLLICAFAALAVAIVIALVRVSESSLASIYEAESARVVGCTREPSLVMEEDLMRVPPLVRWYLRRVGVVGHPRVQTIRARLRGSMRSGRDAPWMPIRAEQVDRFDVPVRLFGMRAAGRFEIGSETLHTYDYGTARMRVRTLSGFSLVDARGAEMNQNETVMWLHDMVVLAPAALLDAPIVWRTTGALTTEGTFTSQGHSVTAELVFDERGDLATFRSADRFESADGVTWRKRGWSTPVSDYRGFAGLRLPSHGEEVWDEPEGELVYARLDLEFLQTNLGCP